MYISALYVMICRLSLKMNFSALFQCLIKLCEVLENNYINSSDLIVYRRNRAHIYSSIAVNRELVKKTGHRLHLIFTGFFHSVTETVLQTNLRFYRSLISSVFIINIHIGHCISVDAYNAYLLSMRVENKKKQRIRLSSFASLRYLRDNFIIFVYSHY